MRPMEAIRYTTTAVAIAAGAAGCGNGVEASQMGSEMRPVGDPTAQDQGQCGPDSWLMTGLNNDQHRFVAGGIPEIGDPNVPEHEAVQKWVDTTALDEDVLAGVAKGVLDIDVNPDSLVDAKTGCATGKAASLKGVLDGTLATAQMTRGEAPTDIVNSGMHGDEFVMAEQAGITGNRNSVHVKYGDKEFWVLERCGNIAVKFGVPGVPTGPTDESLPSPEGPGGFSPKYDGDSTPAGVSGQNRGSGTTPSGPTGPGSGPSGQTPNGEGFVPGEQPVAPPAEQPVTSDPNSHTGPVNPGGALVGPNQGGGNGAPAAPADIDHGPGGGQGGNIGDGGNL